MTFENEVDDRSQKTNGVPPRDKYAREIALEEAASLIVGDREQDYGPPEVNFQRIADILNIILPGKNFSAPDVALAMIGLKIARAAQGYKRDTYVDIAGYAALYIELSENQND